MTSKASAAIMYSKIDADKISLIQNPTDTAMTTFRVIYKSEKNGNVPFAIQTPKMPAPFGISNNQDIPNMKKKPDLKYFLNLSFKNEESNPKIQMFKQKIKEIEERIRKLFLEQFADKMLPLDPDDSTEKHTDKTLKRMFTSSIKKGKAKNDTDIYPDTFRISISVNKENKPDANFYGTELGPDGLPQLQPFTEIKKGADITSIVYVNVYCATGLKKFGVIMKLTQLQYENQEYLDLKRFQIQDDDDSQSESESGEDGVGYEGLEFAIDN